MKRKCPRMLDKPLLLFGLEMEDIGLLGLVGGLGSIFFGPIVPGILTMTGWGILIRFKKDKPQGYLLHWLYQQGMEINGLIPPVIKVSRYGVYGINKIKKFKLY